MLWGINVAEVGNKKNQSTDGKCQLVGVMLDNASNTILHFHSHSAGKKECPDPGGAETPLGYQPDWVG